MKFIDKISKGLDNLEKKLGDSIEKDKRELRDEVSLSGSESDESGTSVNEKTENPDKKGFFDRVLENIDASIEATDVADINATITKDDVTTFLHVINASNYASTEEHHLALKDFFFKHSAESQNFNISKCISIGVRSGSRRAISHRRNPLIELLIDESNRMFTIFDLRNRNVHAFYHFNEIIKFGYDESTNIGNISTEVTRMVIDVKLNRLESSLSIPFMNDDGAYFGFITTRDPFYLQQREAANEVLAAFAYMKNTVSTNTPSAPSEQAPTEVNIADELRKFKHLQEEGLITAEDFEAKKKQLLGV